jgi:hypothetical protein
MKYLAAATRPLRWYFGLIGRINRAGHNWAYAWAMGTGSGAKSA